MSLKIVAWLYQGKRTSTESVRWTDSAWLVAACRNLSRQASVVLPGTRSTEDLNRVSERRGSTTGAPWRGRSLKVECKASGWLGPTWVLWSSYTYAYCYSPGRCLDVDLEGVRGEQRGELLRSHRSVSMYEHQISSDTRWYYSIVSLFATLIIGINDISSIGSEKLILRRGIKT